MGFPSPLHCTLSKSRDEVYFGRGTGDVIIVEFYDFCFDLKQTVNLLTEKCPYYIFPFGENPLCIFFHSVYIAAVRLSMPPSKG